MGARLNHGGERPLTKRSTGRQKRTAFGSLRWRSGAGYLSVISIREIRMINRAVLVLLFLLSGSAIAEEKPPELWSWFKDLSKSKEACEIQSSYALQVIGLENQVENEYGIYGNVRSNRVVVKCIEISPTRSKLMVAVAGYNRDSVELVRNKIISSIQ